LLLLGSHLSLRSPLNLQAPSHLRKRSNNLSSREKQDSFPLPKGQLRIFAGENNPLIFVDFQPEHNREKPTDRRLGEWQTIAWGVKRS
jgi:hypothetical protein